MKNCTFIKNNKHSYIKFIFNLCFGRLKSTDFIYTLCILRLISLLYYVIDYSHILNDEDKYLIFV